MIALLLLALGARDEMTDLIARLRAAPEPQQYTLGVQLGPLARLSHLPLLLKEADAGPDALRPHFIRAIGRVGGEEARTVLRALCMRNDFGSRAEAARQLIRLQDPAGRTTLLELLPKASTEADKIAILGHLSSGSSNAADAVPAILKFLEKEPNDGVRHQAVRVLATYKDAVAFAGLQKIGSNVKDPARGGALAELIRRGDDSAVEDALAVLEQPKVTVVIFDILNAIEQANRRTVLPRLRDLLEKTTDHGLKAALMRTLATMKDQNALPLLTKLSEDKDPTLAKIAMESIIRMSARGQMETLKKAADDDPVKKLDAAEVLLLSDAPEGWTALRSALDTGNERAKMRVLSILQGVRRKEAVEILVTLLDDPTEYVRASAKSNMIQTLAALYPYLKFDPQAPADKLKAWWDKNRRN